MAWPFYWLGCLFSKIMKLTSPPLSGWGSGMATFRLEKWYANHPHKSKIHDIAYAPYDRSMKIANWIQGKNNNFGPWRINKIMR